MNRLGLALDLTCRSSKVDQSSLSIVCRQHTRSVAQSEDSKPEMGSATMTIATTTTTLQISEARLSGSEKKSDSVSKCRVVRPMVEGREWRQTALGPVSGDVRFSLLFFFLIFVLYSHMINQFVSAHMRLRLVHAGTDPSLLSSHAGPSFYSSAKPPPHHG